MTQVALSKDFLEAYAQIPRAQQKKVRSFVEKFRVDPAAGSIHYEPIAKARDSKVHTARIGDDYRAVIIHPPQGDVYLLAWVDHHDEAMGWARNKVFEVHPHTGTLQVWDVQGEVMGSAKAVAATPASAVPQERLLSGHTDDELLLLGVPGALLPAVRALRTERDLDNLSQFLPREASDALYFLAAGYSVEQAIDELDRKAPPETKAEPIDTKNFAAALARPGSQDQFKVVEGGDELGDILDAPLEQWRIFLHPSQAKLVKMRSAGPARVLGGAGTGKTVVAMHRARYLAREVFTGPNDRILFTTFTRNLAADVRRSLKLLCGPEFERIEVTSLDAWARRFLVSRGAKLELLQEHERKSSWDSVLDEAKLGELPRSLFEDEWRAIVQARGITSEAEYLTARRTGRGTPLSRSQRRTAWAVFAAYRALLEQRGKVELEDVIREARLTLESNPGAVRYRAVVADEVQDFTEEQLRLLREIAPDGPNDLFLVGDAHQRIYGRVASLAGAGINVRGRRSRRLVINYRTTARIRTYAESALLGIEVDDLDDGKDTLKATHSLRLGVAPEVRLGLDVGAEADLVTSRVKEWLGEGVEPGAICVVARTHDLIHSRYLPMLKAAKIPCVELGPATTTDDDPRGMDEPKETGKVALATMHRVKGLEFARVVLVAVQEGVVPMALSPDRLPDEAAVEAHEQQEMKLLYVAATRARDRLVVTGHGKAPKWG